MHTLHDPIFRCQVTHNFRVENTKNHSTIIYIRACFWEFQPDNWRRPKHVNITFKIKPSNKQQVTNMYIVGLDL